MRFLQIGTVDAGLVPWAERCSSISCPKLHRHLQHTHIISVLYVYRQFITTVVIYTGGEGVVCNLCCFETVVPIDSNFNTPVVNQQDVFYFFFSELVLSLRKRSTIRRQYLMHPRHQSRVHVCRQRVDRETASERHIYNVPGRATSRANTHPEMGAAAKLQPEQAAIT